MQASRFLKSLQYLAKEAGVDIYINDLEKSDKPDVYFETSYESVIEGIFDPDYPEGVYWAERLECNEPGSVTGEKVIVEKYAHDCKDNFGTGFIMRWRTITGQYYWEDEFFQSFKILGPVKEWEEG